MAHRPGRQRKSSVMRYERNERSRVRGNGWVTFGI
jgi:hypothetical protein